MLRYYFGMIAWVLCGTHAFAQQTVSDDRPDFPGAQDPVSNELTVIAATLAPEEIDRVVLNRLLLEIGQDPERTAEILGVDADLLDEIQISLSNAANFINDNEMANVRAMCQAWNSARASNEDERIEIAAEAYKKRRQFTRDFIARFYRIVILEIESYLPPPALLQFRNYLSDRRRRMANAGNVVSGAIVENFSSAAETVRFHCRAD